MSLTEGTDRLAPPARPASYRSIAARDPVLRREIAARARRSNIEKHRRERIRSPASVGGKAFVAPCGTDPRAPMVAVDATASLNLRPGFAVVAHGPPGLPAGLDSAVVSRRVLASVLAIALLGPFEAFAAGSCGGSSPSGVSCCAHCSTGKACGNSCIAKNLTCHQPAGCACNVQ